jgi:hypothetical protein
MRFTQLTGLVLTASLLTAACSSDPIASDEYQALEQELAQVSADRDAAVSDTKQLKLDLAEVTEDRIRIASELAQAHTDLDQVQSGLAEVSADREAMAAEIAVGERRYDKSLATQIALAEIIADPASFGTELQVLNLLMTYATAGAVMDDVAFGAVSMRDGWENTLFGGLDADLKTWKTWLSEDGSQGGSLWTWSGTGLDGQPFELIGINLDNYDDEGRVTYELVAWPYEDDYVVSAVTGP